jgi:hypothetical protein
MSLTDEQRKRPEANLRKLTSQEVAEELKRRAPALKEKLRGLEEAKRLSPGIMSWTATI